MRMFSWKRLSMEILPTCSPLWLELPQPWGLESATLTCQGSKGKLAQHPWHTKQLQNLGTALPAEWGTSGTVERSVRNTLAQIPCRSGFLLFGDKEESSVFQLSLPFPTTAQWLPQPMPSFKSTLESMSRCELDPSTSIQCGAFLTHCNGDNIASWPKNRILSSASAGSDCVQQDRLPWHRAMLIQQIICSANFPGLPSDI